MNKSNLVHIEIVCKHCKVNDVFIQSLHELGHVELIIENNDCYIEKEQLKKLESMIYFHTELNINIEGIDAIAHLLSKIETLQNELLLTKNKLELYQNE